MNQIVIVTKYPGASAKDVELNVTAKLERRSLKLEISKNIVQVPLKAYRGLQSLQMIISMSYNSKIFY